MGNKAQRKNIHIRRLNIKIRRHQARGKDTAKMEKELGYCMGQARPTFKTGAAVDPRLKKKYT
jgi:hypothetical protein